MKRKDFSKLNIQFETVSNLQFKQEGFIAGMSPFLRGIYSTMYLNYPLNANLLVTNSSPEKSNAIIKEQVLNGYKSIVLVINTKKDSEHKGVFIASLNDMVTLLHAIQLENIAITLQSNDCILTAFSLFIAAIKRLNLALETLQVSVALQKNNVILNNTFYINYLPSIVHYSKKYLPKFNNISIATNQFEPIFNPENELANFLALTYEYIKQTHVNKLTIDDIASKISFNCTLKENTLVTVAKMRAARLLWAKMIYELTPKQEKTCALAIHILDDFSNFHKTITAILGGAQSCICNKNTLNLIENETFITKTVDPWAGSTFLEKTTLEIAENSWNLFLEIKENDGYLKKLILEKTIQGYINKELSLELSIEAAYNNISIEKLNNFFN